MNPEDELYLVLPSNSSPDVYADNRTSSFKVQLAKRIDLQGSWKIALMELQYPNNIYNVVPGENEIRLTQTVELARKKVHQAGERDEECILKEEVPPGRINEYYITVEDQILNCVVKPGHYQNQSDLLKAVNRAVNSEKAMERDLFFIGKNGLVCVRRAEEGGPHTIEMDPTLCRQLGFDRRTFWEMKYEEEAVFPVDASLGKPGQIFVYMDICQEQFVGHAMVPLIRTIPIASDQSFGRTIDFAVENPIYLNVATRSFETVEVLLRDHAGRPIPFSHGTATVLVHLKRTE